MHIIETHAAPSPRRVNIFLAEKGIVVPREERDMMTEDLKSGDFAKLNPWHRVPVLVLDDGRTISETVAICRYFEEIKPEPPLLGVGAIGKAEVEMWNRRVELGLSSAVFSVFRHLHPKMAHLEVPQVAEWGEANKEKVAFELGRLDARLADSRFIAGDDYTIADITALVAVDFMRPARLGRPDVFANVTRWHGEVSARPSAKA
ncbi:MULTISPECIES: glutathione S-transferase family protein [unclassified Hyphomicrobium]|uniref:glutathione S-transferase family protein n=1 Tax=unclassified Hyphomicrobium TaxID=2619925 RepID=UPI000213F454|nr:MULTISPECIES: glutathione S-transferase [unclassified Hyphomicrobium]CCB65538.1 Glutathione S-transferase domain protein [Hyphomicrobium sp. MC1]